MVTVGITSGAAMSLTLDPATPPPAPLGTVIHWSALAADTSNSGAWYRFRVRELGGDYHLIRDYGPNPSLDWTASDHENAYEIEVSARDLATGDVVTRYGAIQMLPLATGDQPIVTATSNSLVFLYSAPPCLEHLGMRVDFYGPNGLVQYTPVKPCAAGRSMNFYLAGLRPRTQYTAHHVVGKYAGPRGIGAEFSVKRGNGVSFTTGDLPPGLYQSKAIVPREGTPIAPDPVLLGSPMGMRPVANDLDGNVLWYGPAGISFISRPEAGGRIWSFTWRAAAGPDQQVIRLFDLLGMTLLETNAAL
jgi:hypothetical protein